MKTEEEEKNLLAYLAWYRELSAEEQEEEIKRMVYEEG